MGAVRVIALHDFTFQNRAVVAGEELSVRAIEAAALRYQHKVKFARPQSVQTREVVPEDEPGVAEPEPDAKPKPKRQYRRRDLTAER